LSCIVETRLYSQQPLLLEFVGMKKKLFSLSLMAFLICAGIFSFSACAADSIVVQKCIASKITGTVQVWTKDQPRWLSAQEGMLCQRNHTVQTLAKSRIAMTFEPAMNAALEENSLLTFDNVLINHSKKNIRMLLKLQKGIFTIAMEPLFGHAALLTIATPSAVVDLNGAEAGLRVSGDTTILDLASGAAKVRQISAKIKSTVEPGMRVTIFPKSPEMVFSPLPPGAIKKTEPQTALRKQPKIAILSVQSSVVSKDNLERVSDYIAEQFEKKSNGKVLFLEDIRSMLASEGMEKLLNCFADSCISHIGSAIGADIVIIGGIGQLGSNHLFSLKMIDVLRDNVISRTSVKVTGDAGKILDEIPTAVENLVKKSERHMDSVMMTPAAAQASGANDAKPYRETVTWIKGGSFVMGSKAVEGEMDETPPHQVTVRGFFMDKYEVTKEDYERAMGVNPTTSKGCAICPVENVNWEEAQAYCKKLGKRLPTEAEWEYACRAGGTMLFHFGNTLSGDQANFNTKQPFDGAPPGPSKEKTVPVGSYAPNAWGLYDMHGNVAEWCSDWYDAAAYGTTAKENPQGPKDGKLKVVRGGAWNSSGAGLRSSRRAGYNPALRLNSVGFRCVKDDTDSTAAQPSGK
jgi:formylglycine-generating enzyme required for sulfatase activity